jgi:hypothetical protein
MPLLLLGGAAARHVDQLLDDLRFVDREDSPRRRRA